jgi:hypothetical protein
MTISKQITEDQARDIISSAYTRFDGDIEYRRFQKKKVVYVGACHIFNNQGTITIEGSEDDLEYWFGFCLPDVKQANAATQKRLSETPRSKPSLSVPYPRRRVG